MWPCLPLHAEKPSLFSRAPLQLLLLVGPLFLLVLPTRGDVFTFQGGGTASLPAEYIGERVILMAPDRTYTFLKSDFRSISPQTPATQEWPEHAQRAQVGDGFERLEAARWAWSHGLVEEAESLIRTPAQKTSKADGRLRQLQQCLLGLDTPWAEPEVGALVRELGGKFLVSRTSHVVLLHQHTEAEAAERVEFLERVIRTFYLEFTDAGIPLNYPPQRLVMVWFRYHRPYLDYLDRHGARAFRNTRGFHHLPRGIVVTYDARSDADQVIGRDALEPQNVDNPGPGDAELLEDSEAGRKLRELERQRLMFDMRWRDLDFGTAAHETVHQLVAQARLAPAYTAFPVWLHEGLAMQYEPVDGGRWAGPGSVSALRLRDYRTMAQPGRLADLLEDKGLGQGYRRDPYAAAWAWVYFLRTIHPRIWVALLNHLRKPDSVATPATRNASALILSLGAGNLKAWEHQWQERMSALWKRGKPGPADQVSDMEPQSREAASEP